MEMSIGKGADWSCDEGNCLRNWISSNRCHSKGEGMTYFRRDITYNASNGRGTNALKSSLAIV